MKITDFKFQARKKGKTRGRPSRQEIMMSWLISNSKAAEIVKVKVKELLLLGHTEVAGKRFVIK